VWLAAGGTGGHVFPALALAQLLQPMGVRAVILSDARGQRFLGDWPASLQRRIVAGTPRRRGALAKCLGLLRLGVGFAQALYHGLRDRPVAVVGFGGYASVPSVLAAWCWGARVVLHEGNAKLGAANRWLLRFADLQAAGLPELKGLPSAFAGKLLVTGTPIRASVVQAFTAWQAPALDQSWHWLVIGGSQGASLFAQLLPEALALLDPALRARVRLSQQCGEKDCAALQRRYAELGVVAELAPFFQDMGERYASSDGVIARAGASTVAELLAVRRPAILIPFAASLDGDQAANAAVMAKLGLAKMVMESDQLAVQLAAAMQEWMQHPAEFAAASGVADTPPDWLKILNLG
jgi:UDP-N-acetylglucosamine--N-acetylmuramyl-(pentapeptide) pyrophosphoryl-undecaprenol N-acetylglucosamine transferase